MFYGTITSNGAIDRTRASTNNFSVTYSSTNAGVYTITFNEYTPYRPVVNVTVESGGSLNIATCQMSTAASNPAYPYTATININYPIFSSANVIATPTNGQFSFHATGGAVIYFDASQNETVTLVCDTITFNKASLMTLSTNIQGITPTTPAGQVTPLGKGVALVGYFPSDYAGKKEINIVLQAGSSLPDYYDLQGWTYGGVASPRGKMWGKNQQGLPQTTLSLDPLLPSKATADEQAPGESKAKEHEDAPSPWRSPEAFVVVAVPDPSKNPPQGVSSLSSDPEVTLAAMPPGNLITS